MLGANKINNEENNNPEMTQDKFSDWQQKINKKHPLVSQFIMNIIVGIILIFIGGCWAIANVPPQPKAKIINTSPSSAEIKIENFGLIPANNVYEIASGPIVEVKPIFKIETGEKYIKLEDTEKENVKRVIVKDLPKSEIVQINITGSSNITINNK